MVGKNGANTHRLFPPARVQVGVKEKDYTALIASIDAALRVVGEEPAARSVELQIRMDLLKLRETLIRARRDRIKDKTIKPDSRSPLGVS
jgi:hypothetical protein